MSASSTCLSEENKCQDEIAHLVPHFKLHYELQEGVVSAQKTLVNRMWIISERFKILDQLSRGIGLCDELTHEFHQIGEKINDSLVELEESLGKCKEKHTHFRKFLETLNVPLATTLIQGNRIRKPIFFYVEMFNNCMAYFDKFVCNARICALVFSIDNPDTLKVFKDLLQKTNTPEDFMELFTPLICFSYFLS